MGAPSIDVGGGVIDPTGAECVSRKHAAKFFGEYRVRLREISQEGSALRQRFREKGLELRAELAEFFSRHTEPRVMIARDGLKGRYAASKSLGCV